MTEQPIKLTAKQVAIAALKAHAEGRLSAQGPTPACRYRDDSGNPCAIGAAIPDDVARAWDEMTGNSIGTICDSKIVRTKDAEALGHMQGAHDRWANARHEAIYDQDPSTTAADLAEREAQFLAACRQYAGKDAPQ